MSIFLSNCHHTFAKTDGSMGWPNSLEGDLIKQAHKEIKEAAAEIERLNARLKVLQKYHKDGPEGFDMSALYAALWDGPAKAEEQGE